MHTYDVTLDTSTYRVYTDNVIAALSRAVRLMQEDGVLFNITTLSTVTIQRVKS